MNEKLLSSTRFDRDDRVQRVKDFAYTSKKSNFDSYKFDLRFIKINKWNVRVATHIHTICVTAN